MVSGDRNWTIGCSSSSVYIHVCNKQRHIGESVRGWYLGQDLVVSVLVKGVTLVRGVATALP